MLMGLNLLSQPAQALNITYLFGSGDNGLTTVTKSIDGITLTASNFSPTSTTSADIDGLCFAGTGGFCPNLTSFNLSFSAPVQLISYTTGYFSLNTATLTFTQGANSSVQTSFANGTTTNFTNQFNVAANQPINVISTNLSPSDSSLQISQLTVDSVPFPWETDALPAIGSTVLFGVGLWTKRKFAKPLQK